MLTLYPGANILVAGKEDIEAQNRKKLFSRCGAIGFEWSHQQQTFALTDEMRLAISRAWTNRHHLALGKQHLRWASALDRDPAHGLGGGTEEVRGLFEAR